MPRFVRRALALLAAAGLGLAATAGTASSAPGLPSPGGIGSALCGAVFNPVACNAAGAVSDLPVSLGDAAGKVFGGFMPTNTVDEWVKSAVKSAAQALAQVQTSMIKMGQPHFLDSWWLTRYAVTFGIGLVVMAVTLTVLASRLSSQGGPEGYQMLRQAGLSATLYVPVMAVAPAAIDIVVQMIYALAGWLGQQTTADTGTSIEQFVRVLNDMHDPNNFALGELGLLVFALVAFFGAVLAMLENGIASFGAQLLMLLVPVVAAIAVYPPARRRLSHVVGIILGLLLTPVMLFLAYWVVWGAAAATMTGRTPDPMMVMLFVAVGSLVSISAPAVLGMLGPAMTSSLGGHPGASQRVRQQGTSARRGATSGARTLDRMAARRGGGSGGSTGGAARGASAGSTSGTASTTKAATGTSSAGAGGAAAGAAAGAGTAGVATAVSTAQQTGQAVHSSAARAGSGHTGGGATSGSSPAGTGASAQPATAGQRSSSTVGTSQTGQPGGASGAAGHSPSSSAGSAPPASGRGTQRIQGVLPITPEPSAANPSASTSTGSGARSRSPQEGQT